MVSVNIGVRRVTGYADGPGGQTGIDKRPAAGRLGVRATGVEGDFIGNRRVHGDADKAAYAYASEDAAWWAAALQRDIGPGGFGENLTIEGLDVTGAVIGERWAVGTAVLQVSQPRIPCATFAGFWEVPDLIKRFTARGAPGAYLRVVRDGEVAAGDPIEVLHRPAHGVTIGETFQALTTSPDLLPALLAAPELPASMRERVLRRVGSPSVGMAGRS
ncbi:MAG TPA: MOSC domain-containing protein [Micromonosporaceae bacterium]|nr:MOSC domain-containing protein [Micromonosporaceae bacterium]